MIGVVLQFVVVVMMLSIGLELRVRDLLAGVRSSGWVLAALVLNLVAFPLAAFAVSELLEVSPGVRAGFILLAAAPAGPVGPLLSRLSHADVALSTALMVVLGVVGLVSTPLTVHLLVASAATEGEGLFIPMFSTLLLFQILPLLAAIGVAARRPALAQRASQPAGLLANVLLAGVVVALLVVRGDVLASLPAEVHLGLIGVLLVVLGPLLATSASDSRLRSLVTVTAVRNMSVALFLAARFFDNPEVEAAILVWSFWMLLLPAGLGLLAGRFRTQVANDGLVETDSPVRAVQARTPVR